MDNQSGGGLLFLDDGTEPAEFIVAEAHALGSRQGLNFGEMLLEGGPECLRHAGKIVVGAPEWFGNDSVDQTELEQVFGGDL